MAGKRTFVYKELLEYQKRICATKVACLGNVSETDKGKYASSFEMGFREAVLLLESKGAIRLKDF